MCIYEIYERFFLVIPFFIPIFVLPNKWLDYDIEADFYFKL